MPKRKTIDDDQEEEQQQIPKKAKTFAERQQEARQKAKAKIYKQTPDTEKKSPAASKKRSHKSTGTTTDSDTDSLSSSASSRRRSTGTAATRRRGRSTAAAAAVGEFKFDPIQEEPEKEAEVAPTGPNGTPLRSNDVGDDANAATYQFSAGKSCEKEDEEASASKKRQKEKRDRLREEMKKKRLSTATTEAKEPAAAAKPPSPSPAKKEPPKAIAAIFAPQNKSKYAAHRPSADKKFDPNQPFPTKDYVVPTAAYCGCGPTPALKKKTRGDLCLEPDGDDVLFGRKDSYSKQKQGYGQLMMGSIPSVDPPYNAQRRDSADEEIEMNRRAVDPDGSVALSTEKSNTRLNNTEEELNASIARTRGMMSFVSESNKKRRAHIGIKASGEENVAVQMLRLPEGGVGKEPEEVDLSERVKDDDKMEEEKVVVADDIAADNDETKPSFVKKIMKGVLLVLFVVMVVQLGFGVYYVATNHVLSPAVTSSNETKSTGLNKMKPDREEKQLHCFIDHPADFFAPNETMNEQLCAGKFVPCPQWGRCHAGLLHDCDDAGNQFSGIKRFVPNENNDGCIATEQVLQIVSFVKKVLATMTVAQHCTIWNKLGKGNVVAPSEKQNYPMFRMEKVLETMKTMLVDDEQSLLNDENMTIQLLMWLEPVDSSVLRFGSLSGEESAIEAIGLANAISPNTLPWPFSCSVRIMTWEAIMLSFGIFWHLAKFAWYSIFNHPVISAVALVMSYVAYLFMKRKRRLEKIRELYPQVLDAAYDRLAEFDNSEGYAALMLRDDIVRSMYPTNIAARNFLYNDVWPRVIAEIHSDNRVRKFRKEANGKSLEHWDLHIQSKRGRRLRKSLGSAPELPAIVKNEEEAPVGRDP